VSRSPTREIDIIIDQPFDIEASEDWLNMVMQQALRVALADDKAGQVSLLLTDDAAVRDLNRKYRGLDEVTDVLSFSAEFPGHWEGPDEPQVNAQNEEEVSDNFPFILPPDQVPPLGEVIVSCPQAQRQASEKGHALKQELALLMVHGVLHLVGHDHLEAQDTELMQGREHLALQHIFQLNVVSP
jgi:probable rRNA maturation factor